MKKIIRKIGKDSLGLIFNKEEVKTEELEEGKVIEINIEKDER